MTGGLNGKLVKVDLSLGKVSVEETPVQAVSRFLGGRGLGAYLLDREVPAPVGPLTPENKLIFTNGLLAGTMASGSSKVNVTFKSPLTGLYANSLCGGHWGPELKFAGLDALIVEGRAAQPVYLWIDDDNVEIRPAGHLWGRLIPETDGMLRDELGDDFIHLACIGPAGEKLNRMACITADRYREFGRAGAGAVMGSKNLKAIAVRGTGTVPVANPDELARLVEEINRELRRHPTARLRRRYGTPEMVQGINHLGFWSTRNFSRGEFERADKLAGPAMRESVVTGDVSCYACPVACGKNTRLHSPLYGRLAMEGPEFETIGLLGANCGVYEWDYILRATEICDSYGFDTMSAGAAVSMAMECFERGIINEQITGGLELRFGSGKALVRLLEMIARREGLGDLLAEGVHYAAEKLGAPELAMHVKGLPLATYDPRGCKGMALTYATSPKGAHHMTSPTMGPEINGDRFTTAGKASLVRDVQLQMAIVDSLAVCSSMRFVLPVAKQLQLLNVVTGMDLAEDKALLIGERIINLERMYNIHLGCSRKEDRLPERFTREKMPAGLSAGQVVDLETMLDDYYSVMGWDNSGIPTPRKLSELGLG